MNETPKTCVVVDPSLGPGSSLVPELIRRGIRVIAVFTPVYRPSKVDAGDLPITIVFLEPARLDVLIEQLKSESVAAVLIGHESAVVWSAELACRLNLPGHSRGLASARIDKFEMNDVVKRFGLATLPFIRTDDSEVAVNWRRSELDRHPVVTKPLRGSLGIGVRICNSDDEIRQSIDSAKQSGRSRLVQKQGHGPIFEVGTVSCDGQHEIVLVMESVKSGPIFDSLRIIHESELEQVRLQCEYAFKVLEALEIKNGAAFVEVMMLNKQTPVMIECNARLIGGMHDPFSNAALGTSQVARFVDAMTDPVGFRNDYRSIRGGHAHARIVPLRSNVEGEIQQSPDPFFAQINSLDSCFHVRNKLETGRWLKKTFDAGTQPGHAFLIHEDSAIVEHDHQLIREWEQDAYVRMLSE